MAGKARSGSATKTLQGRSGATFAALVFGAPVAVAVLLFIHLGPFQDTEVRRYVKHPAEWAEVVLFCCALSAFLAKLRNYRCERMALRADVLPEWHGQAVPVAEASSLLNNVNGLPQRLQESYLARRVRAVLDFLCNRGSANELDDHLRTLCDSDAISLEGSYSLTRFITWAIPILGFLGTVLGITEAIAGVNPDVLEHSLNQVTDGLAQAFDTTALGLALTMICMLISSVVERAEQGVLESVDAYVDRQLAHRFERERTEGSGLPATVQRNTHLLVQATEQLVQRQAEGWRKALEQSEKRLAEAETRRQQIITAAIESALERTLETHARRLAALEKQTVDQSAELLRQLSHCQSALTEATRSFAAQTQALERLQAGGKQLLGLQEALNKNLSALAGAGAFDQAVQSLTAAIHLLTAKSSDMRIRPGAAA